MSKLLINDDDIDTIFSGYIDQYGVIELDEETLAAIISDIVTLCQQRHELYTQIDNTGLKQ